MRWLISVAVLMAASTAQAQVTEWGRVPLDATLEYSAGPPEVYTFPRIRLSGSTSGYAGLVAPATAPSVDWTLPSADGTNGQAIVTDGSAVLSFADVSDVTSDIAGAANQVTKANDGDGTITLGLAQSIIFDGGSAASLDAGTSGSPTAYSLTLEAGEPNAGSTNQVGGNLILKGGRSKGNRGSEIIFQTVIDGSNPSGTTYRSQVEVGRWDKLGRLGVNDTTPDAMIDAVSRSSTLPPLRLQLASSSSASLIEGVNSSGTSLFDVDQTGSIFSSAITASRLVAADANQELNETALSSWLSGTTDQITVANDGDGTATLSLPQSIATNSSVTFGDVSAGDVRVTSLATNRLVASDGVRDLGSVADLTAWIAGTANQITSSDDGDGTITLSTPQDIATSSSVQFGRLGVNGGTPDAPFQVTASGLNTVFDSQIAADARMEFHYNGTKIGALGWGNGFINLNASTGNPVGINVALADAMLEVVADSSTDTVLHLKAASSQSASILRLTDSADNNFVDSGDGLAGSEFVINEQGVDINTRIETTTGQLELDGGTGDLTLTGGVLTLDNGTANTTFNATTNSASGRQFDINFTNTGGGSSAIRYNRSSSEDTDINWHDPGTTDIYMQLDGATGDLILFDGTLDVRSQSTTVPAIKLASGSLLSTPEAGAIEYDGNSLFFTEVGTQRAIDLTNGIITTSTDVTDTAVETTIYTESIAADELHAGQVVIVRMSGYYSVANGSDTFTIRVKLAGTTIESITIPTGVVTDGHWAVRYQMTIRDDSVPASTTFIDEAESNFNNSEDNQVATSESTFDKTAAADITATVDWSASDPGNSVTVTQAYTTFKN